MPETETRDTVSPSQRLAEQVAARLVKESLLSQKEAQKLLPKIAGGTVTAEDWRLAFEITQDKEAKDVS